MSPATLTCETVTDISFVAEQTSTRLAEILALLAAIDAGELLAETPPSAHGRERHQVAVSLLALAEREARTLLHDLRDLAAC